MRTPQAGVRDGPATVRGGAGKGPPPRGALGAVAAATLPRRSRPHSPRPLHPGSLLRAQPQPSALRIRLGPCGSGWPGCRLPPVAAQHAGACRRGRAPCASVRPRSTRPSRGGPCSRCLPWSSSCRRCVSSPALALPPAPTPPRRSSQGEHPRTPCVFSFLFSDVRALFKKVTTRLLATYSLTPG